jgi:hypothetical protein
MTSTSGEKKPFQWEQNKNYNKNLGKKRKEKKRKEEERKGEGGLGHLGPGG